MRNDTPCGELPQTPFALLMQQEAKEKGIPISGTFELTPRCNFNCRMCYVHLAPERIPQFGSELSLEQWLRLAREARDAGMLFLCITGGEPLTYPEFPAFYREVSQMGFQITLQTNASLITGEMAKLLDAYPPNLAKITVYGSDNEVYRQVCGVENGFTRADAGIRRLQQMQIPVFLVTTVIRQNKDDLPNIAAYARSLGLPWIYTSAVHPSIRGADTDYAGSVIREEDATDFRRDVREMLALPPRKPDDKPCQHCKGYRTDFSVSWNGRLRFCNLMNEPDIPVGDRPFPDAWQELINYEEALRWPEECYSCEIRDVCRRCAATIATRSGSIQYVDKNYCDRLKKYIAEERAR